MSADFSDNRDSILPIYAIKSFLHHEAAGGIALMLAAILALVVANSPLYELYDHFLSTYFQIGFEDKLGNPYDTFAVRKPLLLWINDGLMAIFFLLVGLEIKREILVGELSSVQRAMLPGVAAIGGMVMPALLFLAINFAHPENYNGWAIPAATDIAFALGVLAILGKRAPTSLKVFLTAVAIFDDLGAILIIAFFYSHGLHIMALLFSLFCALVLALLNSAKVKNIAPYIMVGVIMWIALLKSGIHATLAGVVIALFIPLEGKLGRDDSPLMRLEKMLHPWVAFLVLPIFGFANAGITFGNITMENIMHPLTLGIAIALIVGKQVGIFGTILLSVKSGLVEKPRGTSWAQLYAVSALCGIGFTMSLFIGKLAFTDISTINEIRMGVMGGSVISALIGYTIMRLSGRMDRYQHELQAAADKEVEEEVKQHFIEKTRGTRLEDLDEKDIPNQPESD